MKSNQKSKELTTTVPVPICVIGSELKSTNNEGIFQHPEIFARLRELNFKISVQDSRIIIIFLIAYQWLNE